MMEIKQQKKFERKQRQLDPVSIYGKVPPNAKEIEDAVLGAIMLEKGAFDVVSGIIKAESFYSEANQRIFKAIATLVSANMPTDLLTVFEQLRKSEELEFVGGPYAVSKLTNSVVSSANIDSHAKIIAEKYMLRELIQLGGELTTEGYEDSTDVFDLLDTFEGKLTKLIAGNNQKTFTGISSAIVKSIQRIEELRILDSNITGIPSGFEAVDKITHGWQNTDLIILAARPSVGKTAFAGNIARNAAHSFLQNHIAVKKLNPLSRAKSVIFFSLEMSTGQLVNRLISCESEIFLDNISNGKLSDEQMRALYNGAVNTLSALPLFIDDSAALNGYELRSKCRQLKTKHNLGLVIIDYLQLMSGGNGRSGNREQEISKISRDLKSLAKELEVPVIALSQLSREPEKRKGDSKMPQLSDLRESGAIEQDADMVMFLYRPEYYDITANEMGESNKGETNLRIAKHRNGSLANIKLRANLAIQKFSDVDSFEDVKEKLGAGTWKPVSNFLEPDKKDDDLPF